jgi:protein-arginine deiminase
VRRILLLALALAACVEPLSGFELEALGLPTTIGAGAGPSSLTVVPDLDDDDLDGAADWNGLRTPENDDYAAFVIHPRAHRPNRTGQRLQLSLLSTDGIRVLDGSDVIFEEAGDAIDLPRTKEPRTLWVQAQRPLAAATVRLTRFAADGDELEHEDLTIRGAPTILNHHGQPAEAVWAVAVDWPDYDNSDMIADYEAELGDRFEAVDGREYGFDVWIQDEFEFATLSASDHRLDLVIDSIRNREIDPVDEDLWEGPGTASGTWGEGWPTSQDSFGNLELTLPFSADGTDYPFGRIYWGDGEGGEPAEGLRDYLYAQGVQAPFVLDSSWLCVGHVDEWMSFVPDATAPRGFRLVYTDTTLAWELLDSLDPDTDLPRYREAHGYRDIGEIVSDARLRAYNDDLQRDYLDANLDRLREEVALADDEIVFIPGLFERVSGCGNPGAAALIPGMANLVVVDFPERQRFFMADPFLRTDDGDRDADPMIAAMRERLPMADLTFLDDFWVYHYGLGEVHCGTNVRRTPDPADWRASALLPEP